MISVTLTPSPIARHLIERRAAEHTGHRVGCPCARCDRIRTTQQRAGRGLLQ